MTDQTHPPSAPIAEDVREALIDAIDGCIPDDIPGYRQRYTDKAADAIMARFEVRLRGTVTEPCEWCPEQHAGFAEWQGDGLAHPSCGREGHGTNFEPARGTVTEPEPSDARPIVQDIPGGCVNCSSSGVIEDYEGDRPCAACDGTGTPRARGGRA